jgi:hypothetical protein
MSTYAIAALVNFAVAQMPDQCSYVNVGVWHGYTFLAGLAGNEKKNCIGIDNFSEFGGPRQDFLQRFEHYGSPFHSFHDMDYREYFGHHHHGPIGVYLYDAAHTYEDQVLGLQLAEPYFADRCIIFVDDTNCEEARQGTLDFLANSVHDYRYVLDVATAHNGHPTFWDGLMILQKVG